MDAEEPAFPIAYRHEYLNGEIATQEHAGMTLRAYIATKAMAALIVQKFGDDSPVGEVVEVVAVTAVQFADALIAELSKS